MTARNVRRALKGDMLRITGVRERGEGGTKAKGVKRQRGRVYSRLSQPSLLAAAGLFADDDEAKSWSCRFCAAIAAKLCWPPAPLAAFACPFDDEEEPPAPPPPNMSNRSLKSAAPAGFGAAAAGVDAAVRATLEADGAGCRALKLEEEGACRPIAGREACKGWEYDDETGGAAGRPADDDDDCGDKRANTLGCAPLAGAADRGAATGAAGAADGATADWKSSKSSSSAAGGGMVALNFGGGVGNGVDAAAVEAGSSSSSSKSNKLTSGCFGAGGGGAAAAEVAGRVRDGADPAPDREADEEDAAPAPVRDDEFVRRTSRSSSSPASYSSKSPAVGCASEKPPGRPPPNTRSVSLFS